MTAKRRTIWFSDEDWEALTVKAESHGFTVSEYLRRLSNGHDIGHSTWAAVKGRLKGEAFTLKGQEGEPLTGHAGWVDPK